MRHRGGLAAGAVALALALLTASCGRDVRSTDGDSSYGGERPVTTEAAAGGTDAPAAGAGTTAARPGGGGGRATATAPGSAPATTRPSGAGGTAGDSGAGIAAAARGGPGSFARVLLQPQPAPRLVLELLQQSGADPYTPAIDRLVTTLGDVSGKPVSRPGSVRLASSDTSHTAAEIRALADAHGARQSGGQAVVHLLYLNGEFADNANVLGVAVRGDVIALFPDVIATAATPLVPARTIEDAVVMHEAGHLLGLVDLVVDTGRDDPEHPGHSRNRGSVMYWAVESSLVATLLDGPPPRDFDAADRRDLAAIRQGG